MPRYESPYDPTTMPKNLEHVIYEKKGHVAYVTINRPEVRNALHSYSYAELRSCWRDIGLDPKQQTYLYVQALVWNVNNGERLFTLEGHKFDIDGLIFTRDDRFLLTGSVDTTIKFWDMKTGQLSRMLTVPAGAGL